MDIPTRGDRLQASAAYSRSSAADSAAYLTTFNAQLGRAFPRQSSVSKFEDFLEMKESQMLEVCRGASIITGNVDKILREKLQRRNIAAHPSEVDILAPTAEEVIRDLVENVVLRLV